MRITKDLYQTSFVFIINHSRQTFVISLSRDWLQTINSEFRNAIKNGIQVGDVNTKTVGSNA